MKEIEGQIQMTLTLDMLKRIVAGRHARFVIAARENGYRDKWDALRADARGAEWPKPVKRAWDRYIHALHKFYYMRDGDKGFLGGRGL